MHENGVPSVRQSSSESAPVFERVSVSFHVHVILMESRRCKAVSTIASRIQQTIERRRDEKLIPLHAAKN